MAMLLSPAMSHAQSISNHAKTTNNELTMSHIQNNKEVIRNLYEQAFNKRNMSLLKDVIHDQYTGLRGGKGVAAFEEPIGQLIKAFPDIQWTIETLVADGDQVAVRWKWQGTHENQFATFAATHKTISNDGMAIFELRDGKIIKSSIQTDRLGFLQALNVVPVDQTLLVNKYAYPNRVSFIDKFFIPAAATKEFYERAGINRKFIKTLPGFIEDEAFTYSDNDGNLICVTVAKWQTMDAYNKAKEAVQAEYKKQGFNPSEMFKRLNIVADRGVYTELE
jgi:steroid delta-isomerase-like uncharacterized protein